MSNSLQPHESQHARPPCPSPTPGAYLNSCPEVALKNIFLGWDSGTISFTAQLPVIADNKHGDDKL